MVAVGVLLAGCGGNDGAKRDDNGIVTKAGSMEVFELRGPSSADDLAAGDCFEPPDEVDGEITTVRAIPCDESHTHEVYLADKTTLANEFGTTYPGLPEVERVSAATCFDTFEPFVGSEVIDSSLTFTYLYPTLASWEGNGTPDGALDRTIACVVVGPATMETFRGSQL